MAKQAITIEDAQNEISDARRLAWNSNSYASKAEKRSNANQAGAAAAADIATRFSVQFPKKSHAEQVEADREMNDNAEPSRG